MANIQNLTPFSSTYQPEKTGRKPGSKNRKTVIREMLTALSETEDIKGIKVEITGEQAMVLSMYKEAKGGNVAAFNALMDGMYGKIPSVQLTDPTKPMDMSAYSTEQLEAMQAILANPANPHDPNAHIQDADIVE